MIVSFYDNKFKGLQNNASLVVDKDSYKLVKKPVELNEMSCVCEAFTENIQPTFLIVKDDYGRYVYGCLAGIPEINTENKTEITATDIKTMLSCDVLLNPLEEEINPTKSVLSWIKYIFNQSNTQFLSKTCTCDLIINENVKDIVFNDDDIENGLVPLSEKAVYNALEEIQKYLRVYDLFLDTQIDLKNEKVIFILGKTMYRQMNIKLWEYGIKNYGKWVADINECQGYFTNKDTGEWIEGPNYILTSKNKITADLIKRDIYPVKRKIITNDSSLEEANAEALSTLADSLYNENIEIPSSEQQPDFETRFEVFVERGKEKYKDLPCGLIKFQIGYRYTDIFY